MRSQVRRMHQHVQRFSSRRGGRGFGKTGRGQITGWIRCRFALLINPVEFLLWIPTKNKAVMSQMLVTVVQAKIENDSRTSRFVFSPSLECLRDLAIHEFAMSSNTIGIGNDRGNVDRFSVGSSQT